MIVFLRLAVFFVLCVIGKTGFIPHSKYGIPYFLLIDIQELVRAQNQKAITNQGIGAIRSTALSE